MPDVDNRNICSECERCNECGAYTDQCECCRICGDESCYCCTDCQQQGGECICCTNCGAAPGDCKCCQECDCYEDDCECETPSLTPLMDGTVREAEPAKAEGPGVDDSYLDEAFADVSSLASHQAWAESWHQPTKQHFVRELEGFLSRVQPFRSACPKPDNFVHSGRECGMDVRHDFHVIHHKGKDGGEATLIAPDHNVVRQASYERHEAIKQNQIKEGVR